MPSIVPLDPDFRLQVLDAPPALAPETEARIADIWTALKRERGDALFNAPLYALVGHTRSEVTIRPLEYRHLAALKTDPSLAARGLDRVFMGVMGLIVCRDGLILGKRSPKAFFYAGLWEPAPAGTLDRPDPHTKVLEEMEEELGVSRDHVQSATPMALVFDRLGHFDTVDILFRIDLAVDGDEVRRAWTGLGTDEYTDIAIVPLAELGAFSAGTDRKVIPPLACILDWAGMA